MPDINGSGNADVTNDVGTLNGSPQGGPINNIDMSGDDTVTVTNSTITGYIDTGSDHDDITVIDSTVGGIIDSGSNRDTVTIGGSSVGDVDLGSSDDTLNFYDSTSSGTLDGNSGDNSLNLPQGTVVNDSSAGTFTVINGVSYTVTSGSFTLPTGQTVSYTSFDQGTGFACFVKGTRISTPVGMIPIEDIKVGSTVVTLDGETRTVRWIGNRRFEAAELSENPKLHPVRIAAGALGHGLPLRDLFVSRQHRMLVRSRIVQRMFQTPQVLVSAIKLVDIPGVSLSKKAAQVHYFHMMLDTHDAVLAEEAPSETLLPGGHALRSFDIQSRGEILAMFPEFVATTNPPPAYCPIPPPKQQRQLVKRHIKNAVPLLDCEYSRELIATKARHTA